MISRKRFFKTRHETDSKINIKQKKQKRVVCLQGMKNVSRHESNKILDVILVK